MPRTSSCHPNPCPSPSYLTSWTSSTRSRATFGSSFRRPRRSGDRAAAAYRTYHVVERRRTVDDVELDLLDSLRRDSILMTRPTKGGGDTSVNRSTSSHSASVRKPSTIITGGSTCSHLTRPSKAPKSTSHRPSRAAGCDPAMAFLALSAIDGSCPAFSGSGNDDAHTFCNGPSASQRSSSGADKRRYEEGRVLILSLRPTGIGFLTIKHASTTERPRDDSGSSA
mmetsp:Transcript_31388/g.66852  ORF Transcript_31388/g.66852 Transcript_31388/m.66852 type:complete len:225 (+) Transcript_31388:610-1284(+)